MNICLIKLLSRASPYHQRYTIRVSANRGGQEHSRSALIAPSEERETGSLVVRAWAAKNQFGTLILTVFGSSSDVQSGFFDVELKDF